MTVLMGKNEGEERMKRENMKPNSQVALDHDYYSENPEVNSKKSKEIKQIEYDGQDDEQYRLKKAIGGVAKLRKGYPLTEKMV
jgi:ATP-dependent 26S proteasome regulatory subunit